MATRKQFKVTLDGKFPFDMLRYDECTPLTTLDANMMYDVGQRTITLTSKHNPTCERWFSFGVIAIDRS